MKHMHAALLIAALLVPGWLVAEENAPAEPVEITADRVERDEAAGTLVYQGNVVIVRGLLTVQGDYLRINELEDGNKIAHITGNPVTFENTDEQGRLMTGSSLQADYDLNSDILVLTRDAVIEQEGDSVRSQRIEIDNKTKVARAGGQGQRVHSVIKAQDN